MEYNLQVIIEQDEDGKYVAECPSLRGCYTQGDTFEEAVGNIREVIEMCIEELKEENSEIPIMEIVGIKNIKITA
jgi:predicted RNase H-like HicB family nuclease